MVQERVGLEHDLLPQRLLHVPQHAGLLALQHARDIGVHPQHDAVPVEVGGELAHLRENLETDRRARLDGAGARTVGALIGELPLEALLHALPRDDDQSEIRDLHGLGRCAVASQLLLERLLHLLAVLLLLHVDEIEDDNPAQVPQPDLPHDLARRLEVRLDDGVLESPGRLLADVAPGVHVDRDEGFRLVDDDVAAGLQPDLAAERLVDLGLDAILVEYRVRFRVPLHPRGEGRHDALDELDGAAKLTRVVDADRGEVLVEQVPQQLDHEALLPVERRGRPQRVGALAELGPRLVEELQVADDVRLGTPRGGGPDDQAPGEPVLFPELAHDRAQPAALGAVLDLAGDAHVIDGGHEHEKAARDGDVRGEARALGAERLLRDLDDDLLALVEEFLDLRLVGPAVLGGVGLAARVPPASAAAALFLVARRRVARVGRGRRARLPRARVLRPGAARVGRRLGALVFVTRFELLERLERVHHVRHVEEAIALEPELHEGGLHAGQHLRDAPLVDVAHHSALILALDEELRHLVVLEDGYARFVVVRGDDHLLRHGTCSVGAGRHEGRRTAARPGRAPPPRAAAMRWPAATR